MNCESYFLLKAKARDIISWFTNVLHDINLQEMRRKVAETMRLLQAKRDRIKATCKIIEKKEATTEKVNKILHKGQRREAHITKQKEEELVFGKPKPDDKKEDKQEDKQ